MDKKAKRIYDKAMNHYEKGQINKALELCEEALSEGLDNSHVLNFKGLLLYQKGSLNEAVTVWRINKDLNNDDIAKKYIEDIAADENRFELYKQGEEALKQFKIDKALELFRICAESDFNSIKVNSGIAMCYQRKGDFNKAKEYVEKALRIDKNAVTARSIERELKDDGIYTESGESSKKFIIGIIILFFVVAIIAGGYLAMSKFKSKSLTDSKNIALNENNENDDAQGRQNSEEKSDTASDETIKESTVQNFDKEKLKTLMDNNDLDGVYEQLKNVKKESISSDNIDVYNKAVNLMKDKGISKFYQYGLWCFNQGNYADAKISLDKAYAYSEGSSIKEHILFYRASNSYYQSDSKNALDQLEEYYKQYPKGSYAQDALYELAMASNPIDKEKSKAYANKLMNNFPNSIYINDNIKSILNS